MKCPKCNHRAVVYDTRSYTDPAGFIYTERRLRCLNCENRFMTIEVPLETWIDVQKQKTT